ncbi:hypothetical protein Fmac_025013 [Flemingia macrophylla]|uniref:Rhodanese domain-containing protein n=1 Tax=Flemingia macrophylla TaxID=520843 RepID=A0ABD1LSR6_9FABA
MVFGVEYQSPPPAILILSGPPPAATHNSPLTDSATATVALVSSGDFDSLWPRCVSPQLSPFEVSRRFHSLVPLHPYSHRDLELHPYSHRDSHRLGPFTYPLTSPSSHISPSFHDLSSPPHPHSHYDLERHLHSHNDSPPPLALDLSPFRRLPVDSSIRKLLKGGRDLYDSLIAAIIRNLKIVKDSSRVIVLDVDGTRSKGIARSLRKIGVKASLSIPAAIFANPYVVQGGFRSWTKQGIRIKELKLETTLSILNEEAEAILEDVSPSPLQLLGYGTRGRLYGVGKVGSALRLGDAFPNLSCGRSTQESEKILQLEQQVRQSREEARQSREEARQSREQNERLQCQFESLFNVVLPLLPSDTQQLLQQQANMQPDNEDDQQPSSAAGHYGNDY